MNVIDVIKEKMQKYPHVKYDVTENSVTVFPTSENGFEVSMYIERYNTEPYVVYYDGAWHEHFTDSETALECFAFGLSTECRLKVTSRGGRPYIWKVESRQAGGWQPDSTTAFFPARFWWRKEVRYLQNDLIK